VIIGEQFLSGGFHSISFQIPGVRFHQ